jgi:predicted Zn-dependent protease
VTKLPSALSTGAPLRGLAGAVLALGLGGCVLTEQAAQPEQAASVARQTVPPPPRTAGLDTTSEREHRRLVAAFGGEYRAPQMQALLTEIVTRLADAAERPVAPFRVTILNSSVVNAFALPGGSVYVTRGLLSLANDTSEVASVLAHEIAHVIARHAVERQELERTATLVDRVRSDVLQDVETARTRQAEGRVAIASFSRQQELEADALSVRMAGRAGFDPYGAARFLNSLGRSTAIRQAMLGQTGSTQPDFTATHPSTPERIQLVTLAARQIGAPGFGEADRNRYLLAVQGMTIADDAGQGFVRGRQFLHPKLGIGFTAPEGFVLENTREAVLGVVPNQGLALRFDTARINTGQALEGYVGSGLIDGATTGPVESLTINGLPAATSIARTEDWTFRVAAIRVGAQTFRLTFAARSFTSEADERFRESLGSFRRLTAEEASVRPLRLALVTARGGDTVETLAARMALDEPRVARFRVLNGLSEADGIIAGQRYKIVE